MTKFEIIDLGVDYPDYFQGFGCAFTEFDNSVVGVGSTEAEALEDCIEQAAESGLDVDAALETAIREDYGPADGVLEPSEDDEFCMDAELPYFYVGLRW